MRPLYLRAGSRARSSRRRLRLLHTVFNTRPRVARIRLVHLLDVVGNVELAEAVGEVAPQMQLRLYHREEEQEPLVSHHRLSVVPALPTHHQHLAACVHPNLNKRVENQRRAPHVSDPHEALQRLLRQYLYFCTSQASKLSVSIRTFVLEKLVKLLIVQVGWLENTTGRLGLRSCFMSDT